MSQLTQSKEQLEDKLNDIKGDSPFTVCVQVHPDSGFQKTVQSL